MYLLEEKEENGREEMSHELSLSEYILYFLWCFCSCTISFRHFKLYLCSTSKCTSGVQCTYFMSMLLSQTAKTVTGDHWTTFHEMQWQNATCSK